ncbi:MAG: threonine ammonia-lyase [Hyphomonadaceae bacterium]|nr:threonine ammonia-lyase [Hyphomonadaceae bacterium]
MPDQAQAKAQARNSAPAVTYDQIVEASKRLAGHIERTPLRLSRTLSAITGAETWVKFENFQFTAAYKERGALNKLMQLTPAERKQGVIAASAGNHSQALAYHAARLGIPVTILMPVNTPFVKIEQTRSHGAEIVLFGETFDESAAKAVEIRDQRDLVFVHPFNDPDVMAGQGTVALEMFEDQPELEVLPVPIGGGGLISGVATVARHINPEVRIFGVEPAMYPSFTSRMRGLASTGRGQTIAEGIAVKKVGDLAYEVARPLIDDVLLLEEKEFERAIALYCNVEKVVVEGAGAASLAALLAYPEKFRGKKTGLIVTGGNIDTRLLAAVLTRSMIRDGRITHLRFIGDDRPGILAEIAFIIGDSGGNILQVGHHRMTLDAPAKGVEFDIEIEARDAKHSEEIITALAAKGYAPRRM